MAVSVQDIRGPHARAAFGVVAPFDMELDAELWRWAPSDVDILITRTPYVDSAVTVELAHQISRPPEIAAGTRNLVAGRAGVVAYACTSGSFVAGVEGERMLRAAMRDAGAIDPLTTSGALVEALDTLGTRRVSVATPYLPTLSHLLDGFLLDNGIEVRGHASLGLDREIWSVSYQDTAELVRRADRPDAEAIVVSCTNLPTYDLLAPLEAELGKPVVSANQATVWAALRRMCRKAVGAGQGLVEAEFRGTADLSRPGLSVPASAPFIHEPQPVLADASASFSAELDAVARTPPVSPVMSRSMRP